MFQNQQYGAPQQQPGGANNYYASVKGLAITCAIICTLLAGPLLGHWTEEWITGLIEQIYGEEWIELGLPVWKGLCFAFVFFATRAFVVAAIVAGGVGLAQRLPLLAAV